MEIYFVSDSEKLTIYINDMELQIIVCNNDMITTKLTESVIKIFNGIFTFQKFGFICKLKENTTKIK